MTADQLKAWEVFAAAAMAGVMANPEAGCSTPFDIAYHANRCAEEMMKHRQARVNAQQVKANIEAQIKANIEVHDRLTSHNVGIAALGPVHSTAAIEWPSQGNLGLKVAPSKDESTQAGFFISAHSGKVAE